MSEGPVIIIKKKKKGGHGGHHGGAWKVAYADFVTAMMALFIVLWILGQDEAVQQVVGAYFRDPMAFEQAVASGAYSGNTVGEASSSTGNMVLMPFTVPTPGETPDDAGNFSGGSGQNQKEILEAMAEKIKKEISKTPEFDRLKDKVQIQVGENMAIIELIEPQGTYFFEISDSQMKPEAKKLLGLIAKELNNLPNKIIIAGHTDSRPFKSDSYSNWELSADRANSARRVMESYGYEGSKILEVKGCSDKVLKYPEDPFSPMNRRISIVVLFENNISEKPVEEEKIHKEPVKEENHMEKNKIHQDNSEEKNINH